MAITLTGNTGITAPTEGIATSTFGNGGVIQVVQTAETAASVLNSGSAIAADTDYTILSRTITPATTSNQVLIMASIYLDVSGSNYDGTYLKLMRNSTQICIADASGNRNRASATFEKASVTNRPSHTSVHFLDTPGIEGSAVTYKINVIDTSGSGPIVYFNRGSSDSDSDSYTNTVSTLICMEVVA